MANVKKEAVETTETAKEPTNETCTQEICTKLSPNKEFSESDSVAELLEKFEAKENPSERFLVCIKHLKAIRTELEREALDIEVVDSEIVE